MLVLNKSMNITISSDTGISYYDGNHYQLKTNELKLMKKIFDWYQEPKNSKDYPKINGKSNRYIQQIVEKLVSLRILIHDTKHIPERNDYYFRTYSDEVEQKVASAKLLIIGCGTVGTSVSLCLAKLGFTHLELIDDDIVTEHSLNAQPIFAKHDLGIKKGLVIKEYVYNNISNHCKVVYRDTRLSTIKDLAPLFVNNSYDYVIDCSDEKSEQLQMDMLELFEQTDTKYIQTGYYGNVNIIARIIDYKEFKDMVSEDFYTSEFFCKYSHNKGIILDSLTLGSLIARVILNDYIAKPESNLLAQFNFQNMSLIDTASDVRQRKEKFYQKVHHKLGTILSSKQMEKILDDYSLSQTITKPLLNTFQYVRFLEALDMIRATNNTHNSTSISQLLGVKVYQEDTELQALLDKVNLKRHKYVTSDLHKDMELSNTFSLKDIQRDIKQCLEDKKAELLSQLSKSRNKQLDSKFYHIAGIKQALFDKFANQLKLLSFSEYQKIISRSDLEKLSFSDKTHEVLDYYCFRDLESTYFGSKSKAIAFLHRVLSAVSQELGSYFMDSVQKFNLIIDVYSNKRFGKSVTLTSTGEGIAYATYDSTYRSLLTVLHEFFHMFSSRQMTEEFYWKETSVIYNEVLAEAILMKILQLDSQGDKELENFKKIIRYKLYRDIIYNLEQIYFLNQIDHFLMSNKELKAVDYDSIWLNLNQLNPNALKFKNQGDFINNYLLNPKMYHPTEHIIKDMLIAVLAICYGECIVESLLQQQLLYSDLNTELAYKSLPELIHNALTILKEKHL